MQKLIIPLALLLSLTACTQTVLEEDSITTTISVGVPEETKTAISAPDAEGWRTVTWTTGDMLNVNGVASQALSSAYNGTSTAEFTFGAALTYPYSILYPASFYKESGVIVLPSCQSKMPGDDDIATNTLPMYGYAASAGDNMNLHHLCSIVKFQIKLAEKDGAVPTIAAVMFMGNNGEQVCGEFNLNYSTGELTGNSGSQSFKSVTGLSAKSGTDGSVINCNIVIPAGVYSQGFTIRVVDGNGYCQDKIVNVSKTFAAGASYRFQQFTYVPKEKLADAVIFTAQDLVDFAKKWNNYGFEGNTASAYIANDIAFDNETSAAFVATGGIGTATKPDGTGTNHYNGVFNGNGHSISGLTSTVPVFAYTGGAAEIKNLILDNSCSFTCPAGGSADWGVLVGRQKGSVKDCNSSANLTIQANTNAALKNIGGITGRVYGGTIEGCTMAGAISFPSGTFTDKQLNIGGIAGSLDYENSDVLCCSLTGTITVSDGTQYGGPGYTTTRTGIYIGGIAGYVSKSSIIAGCTTSSSASLTLAGKFTAKAGGIAGCMVAGTIKNCSNEAPVKFSSDDDKDATTGSEIAGIIGECGASSSAEGATITHCTNSATVSTYCNSKTLYLGGIAGTLIKGSADNCSNSGLVARYNAGAAAGHRNRYCSIGGIIGYLNTGTTVSASSFSGKLYSQDHTTSTYATYDVGGIVGNTAGSNTISDCECTASEIRSRGDKDTKPNPSLTRDLVGGIAGNLKSTTVSNCNVSTSLVNLYSVNCMEGGICGTMDATSSISSCNVTDTKITKNNVSGSVLGAISGTTASGSSINNCTISGKWTADNGTTWTDFVIGDISSDTNFTGNGNTSYTRAYDLTGKVTCSGKGVANVVVSDGYTSTLTDSDGMYYIQSSDSTTCVSVSIPSGYMVASSAGIPAFWKKLSDVTESAGVKTVDFSLNKVSNPDNWTIYMYADVQIRKTINNYDKIAFKSQDTAKDLFSDIKDRATATGGNIVGISLGDQVHEYQDLYVTYLSSNELGKLNFPNFSLLGNHDYDTDAENYLAGAANFESKLCPARYSFNIGKFHVIVLDNARTLKGAAEGKGLCEETVLQWLKSDLKYVPLSTPIILCSHRPLFMELYTGGASPYVRDISTRSWAKGKEYGTILAGYKKVYAFNGDLHTMFNYKYTSGEKQNIECHAVPRSTGELWTNQFLNSCGTPRGYLEIKINGEDLVYKFKPVAYQTGSLVAGPSPMTFRDFATTSGKFYMKSAYKSNKGALLDDFYQIHAYAPGAGYGAATKYPNDVIAVVFMYDDRWSDVTFKFSGGVQTMTRIAIEENLNDPGYSWLHDYYKTNDQYLKKESGYTNTHPLYNAFHCTPQAGVKSGTVCVTDHFGNTYEYALSWE